MKFFNLELIIYFMIKIKSSQLIRLENYNVLFFQNLFYIVFCKGHKNIFSIS